MIIVNLKNRHCVLAARTFQWIITKVGENGAAPFIKREQNRMFLLRDSTVQFLILFSMAGINAVITDHFEMLFRDVLDKKFHKFESCDSHNHKFIVFVTVVMESDIFTIIFINAFCGDNRSAKVTTDVFRNFSWPAQSRLGINIKTLFAVLVDVRFDSFKRTAYFRFQFIQKSSAECIAKKCVVKVFESAPERRVSDTAFRDKTVDVRVPLKTAAKSMEDTDKTRGKKLGFIFFVEHTEDDASDGRKQEVQKSSVFQKEDTRFFRNSKNAVTMGTVDEFKRHRSSAVNGVHVAAGRTKAAVTAEGNKLEIAAFGTGIHGTAKGRITTVDHLIYVLDNRWTWMSKIYKFFIMIDKNVL